MKIICPHCGVKGTAAEELVEKKVRCPECTKVFRVIEQVLAPVDVIGEEPGAVAQEAVAEEQIVSAEDHDVAHQVIAEESAPAEEVIEEEVILPEGVALCGQCGFAFSEQFTEVVGPETFCCLCAGLRPVAA